MDSYWLLFNTSVCQWIVNLCYINKFYKETKKREYRIEFDEIDRYLIEFKYYADKKKQFAVTIYHNNKLITIVDFENPTEFCKKLCSDFNPSVVKFLKLNLCASKFKC